MKVALYKWNKKLAKATAGLSIFSGLLTLVFAPFAYVSGALPTVHSLMVMLVVALFFLIMGQTAYMNITVLEKLEND